MKYVATYNSDANTTRYGNYVTTMALVEYKAGMLRKTHNKDEDPRNCTYVATFINFVMTNLTKGRHLRHDINVATKLQQNLKTYKLSCNVATHTNNVTTKTLTGPAWKSTNSTLNSDPSF